MSKHVGLYCRDTGGKMMTVGADAHAPEHIAY